HGTGVAIVDRQGQVAAGAGAPFDLGWLRRAATGAATTDGEVAVRSPAAQDFLVGGLDKDGERLGWVAVGPIGTGVDSAAAARLVRHVGSVLLPVLHASLERRLSATIHVSAMEESYRTLEGKNQQLQAAFLRLQEADRIKTNFLATMSHELRTPLTSIIGYSEMLLEGLAGQLGAEQREYVETVLGKADQLLQLITGILDVSLLESGSLRIERHPVELADVLDSVVASFVTQAGKRRIVIDAPRPAVPRALGDVRKIRQVLWNLVANAVKFTRDGGAIGVEAEVGLLSPADEVGRFGAPLVEPGEKLGRYGVRVRVRDTGIGISPEMQHHIFEPFFQVDSSSTREYGGTGLGLTLAKRYVEAHGGTIWVDSTPGAGSTFTFSLPAVTEELAGFLAERP
ncbi:MAG TPA: HAMP domain-containing sensor histidine kinase, partial [Kofleriaceae bacterium]|nr:HAMP domain-containing sensor histidine kinase [Kofleriaceae bacterium]